MKLSIAPSILSADFSKLGEEIQAVERGGADIIHVDVMDGRFVPPITIGAQVVRDIHKVTSLPLDVHLMVEEPDHLLDSFVDAGAAAITVHVEAVRHLDRTLRYLRSRNVKVGLALNPATPLTSMFYVLGLVDLVLFMSVNPGYGGQRFLDYCVSKIEALRAEVVRRRLGTLIEVDGGVSLENVAQVARAGADIIVAGSAVFKAPDYGVAIRTLRSTAIEACLGK